MSGIFIRNPKCATISIRNTIGQCKLDIRFDEMEAHQRASQWKDKLPDYDKHHVFSVCRNPYDRLLSGWLFICRRKLPKHQNILSTYQGNFQKFVLNLKDDFNMDLTEVDMVTWPQYKWLTDNNGHMIVNEVGRFENLQEWWKQLCTTQKWRHVPLRKTNSTSHAHWKQYYTAEMIEVVNKQYADDFNLLNYPML